MKKILVLSVMLVLCSMMVSAVMTTPSGQEYVDRVGQITLSSAGGGLFNINIFIKDAATGATLESGTVLNDWGTNFDAVFSLNSGDVTLSIYDSTGNVLKGSITNLGASFAGSDGNILSTHISNAASGTINGQFDIDGDQVLPLGADYSDDQGFSLSYMSLESTSNPVSSMTSTLIAADIDDPNSGTPDMDLSSVFTIGGSSQSPSGGPDPVPEFKSTGIVILMLLVAAGLVFVFMTKKKTQEQ